MARYTLYYILRTCKDTIRKFFDSSVLIVRSYFSPKFKFDGTLIEDRLDMYKDIYDPDFTDAVIYKKLDFVLDIIPRKQWSTMGWFCFEPAHVDLSLFYCGVCVGFTSFRLFESNDLKLRNCTAEIPYLKFKELLDNSEVNYDQEAAAHN